MLEKPVMERYTRVKLKKRFEVNVPITFFQNSFFKVGKIKIPEMTK